MEKIKDLYNKLKENVSLAVVGKDEAVRYMTAALVCGGHIIITDVPGTGKTLLTKSFASSLSLSFCRIQFTPDLMPSDITGIRYFNMKEQEFEFLPGPVFANVVMADEINRATPKTQAGMLECMAERQVTVDGERHALPEPFMVAATQNPIEASGVYELPEAQLDRFLLSIPMGLPSHRQTVDILKKYDKRSAAPVLSPVADAADILAAAEELDEVYVSEDVFSYIVSICEATRRAEGVELGASPRAALALLNVSKFIAAVNGRDYLLPDDVKECAPRVLCHRLIMTAAASIKPDAAAKAVDAVLEQTPAPTEDQSAYKFRK
ncbi:MAG: MoxR family ATPase [Clostridia bacterium]|nr:MoxR family ATPase [Clostridia bacterium]